MLKSQIFFPCNFRI